MIRGNTAAAPARGNRGRLTHVTRAQLEPLWSRHDIPSRRIAAALGVTREALRQKAMRLGLPPRAGNQRCNQKVDDATFARMWQAGVSTTEMARHFGYAHPSAIGHRRVLLGLPPRSRRRGGNKTGGWVETITLREFAEMEMGRLMAEEQRKGAA